jgi:3-hydroxybutyryl-CoA dehydrogenase
VGVVGLGRLGRGIAACLLGHRIPVVGWAPSDAEHADARAFIDTAITELIERAHFPPSLRDQWADLYTPTSSLAELSGCTFIIESVLEDLAVKQTTFDAIESAVGADVPIASNTSAIPICRLQAGRRVPGRFLGMHWAQPCHATRFLELIRGEQTSDAALAAAQALSLACGKEPCLVQKDVPGFIVNRLGYAMYREALHLIEMGVADAETIDRAFRNACGLWASLDGPLRWMDISGGPALYAKVMQDLLPHLSRATELPPPMAEMLASGAHGTANGRGFYAYEPGDAARWDRAFTDHVWAIRRLQDEERP